MNHFIAFARGLAIFKTRRISKVEQAQTLRDNLPSSITFKGAFDKSGNYALSSLLDIETVGNTVSHSLRSHPRLNNLKDILVIPSWQVEHGLSQLVSDVSRYWAVTFRPNNFGVEIDGYIWRAGLTFLPTPLESSFSSQHIDSSPASNKKVIILGGEGSIVRFLKKENKATEKRITFGDPTETIEQAIRIDFGKAVESTSRSARTVRGILTQ
jgi:hypothetical protein